jgi:endonuclease/exonuclease/phosphatase (EEP) superfamily protein YafD
MRNRVGFWGWVVRVLAVGYPVALLLVILGFRLVGERWWATCAALYLPRIGFALPLPVLTLLLALRGPRRLLIGQAVALVLLVFPLMGLRISGGAAPTPGAVRLRVVSLNVATGGLGTPGILAQLRALHADVILLQEVHLNQYDALRAGLAEYQIQAVKQFWLASRFPIEEAVEPPMIPHQGKMRSPRFMHYRVSTPAGSVRIYNVHPISPRDALEDLRGEGLRHEVMSGRFWSSAARAKVTANATLRLAQIQAIAEGAGRSPHPVIIGGDTNLPGLSWALGRWLGDFQDGFAAAGKGFGYTFPAPRRPWMRIDRILASPRFRFLRFDVVEERVSDHLAVVADLELGPAGR